MDENKNTQNAPDQLPTQPAPPPSPLPIQSINPVSIEQTERKPSKWRYFFIVLGILQITGVAVFFLIMIGLAQDAKKGASGTEFIALALFATLVPVVGFAALINCIGLPIYMIKHKPRTVGLTFSIVSLIISTLLVLFGAFTVYQSVFVLPQIERNSFDRLEKKQKQFASDNAKPEITKEEAIELLKTCKLNGFYYTDQTDRDNGGWGELSTTGVVLTKIDGEPFRISIADRHITDLVPIAREAQKTCGVPQFWHDGSYE